MPSPNQYSGALGMRRALNDLAVAKGVRRPYDDVPVAAATTPGQQGLTAFGRGPNRGFIDDGVYRPGPGSQSEGARLIPVKTTSNESDWVLDPNWAPFKGTVEVPRPSGGALVLDEGAKRYHTYQYEHVIDGAEHLPPETLAEILRQNPAPNEILKPATAKGANNDAAAPFPFNQVKSYDRTSSDGQHWVVNVTRSVPDGLHILSDGWVASTFVRRADGKVVLLTYGEGDSPVQNPKTKLGQRVGEPVNKAVWRWRAGHVQRYVTQALHDLNGPPATHRDKGLGPVFDTAPY